MQRIGSPQLRRRLWSVRDIAMRTAINRTWESILARIPRRLIAAIIIILWCLEQLDRLESAEYIPAFARPILLVLKPYEWKLQLALIVLLILVYLRHEHKLQSSIEKMRAELLAVQEKESALADALLDQDRVTYIAKERLALEKSITEYYRAWLDFDRAVRDPKDWDVRDGYGTFHRAHADMGKWLGNVKDISESVFKIEWPKTLGTKTDAQADLTGIPEALMRQYLDTYLDHKSQAPIIESVLMEIDTRSQTAMTRIRERMSRGAPW